MSLSSPLSEAATDPEKVSRAVMLAGKNLYCERDDRVLFKDLEFELHEGMVMQLRGSNGSGKTTLMRILCGLNDSYRGVLEWYGEPVEEQLGDYYQSLHYIGHRVGVSRVLTPMENLRWSCSLKAEVDDHLIEETLADLGLRGYEESPCNTLSAGQQQRVALARILINPMKLWILDEPFTTLDKKGVAQLEANIQKHAESGGAVMVTTHHKLDIPGMDILDLG
jgi:heme exporter protein A